MRLQDIKVGDKLMMGSPKFLREGRNEKIREVTVIAVGAYTSVISACGDPGYAVLDGGVKRVVVEISKADYMGPVWVQRNAATDAQREKLKKTMFYYVVTGQHLMTSEEWGLKRAPHIEMQAMMDKYRDDSKEAYSAFALVTTTAVGKKLPAPIKVRLEKRWGSREIPAKDGTTYKITIEVEHDQIAALVGEKAWAKILEAEKAYVEVASNPPKCANGPDFERTIVHVVSK